MDGDTVFEPGTVAALVQPFADPSIGAVAGNARVADRARLLGRLQHIEYVIGFNIDRRVQDSWGSSPPCRARSARSARRALRAVGGVSADTLAEDTDLAITLGRAGWRTVFEPTARAWTEAPATLGQLWRQRYRWSYGIMQSLWKHRRAIVESGPSGHVGRVGLALTALFQIVLPLLAPMVDIYLVYGLLFLDPVVTAVTWGGVLVVQLTLGAIAFRLEGEPLRALLAAPGAAVRVPTAHVRGAHPVHRHRRRRDRTELAETPAHGCLHRRTARHRRGGHPRARGSSRRGPPMNRSRLRWALLLVAAVTLLAACASTPPVAADPPTITPNPALRPRRLPPPHRPRRRRRSNRSR